MKGAIAIVVKKQVKKLCIASVIYSCYNRFSNVVLMEVIPIFQTLQISFLHYSIHINLSPNFGDRKSPLFHFDFIIPLFSIVSKIGDILQLIFFNCLKWEITFYCLNAHTKLMLSLI